MDYEKAYKAVLKTATQWIKDGCTDKEKICLECVFPELRMSEDERIREIIRLALIASEDELSDFYKVHNIHRKECTDWLEKLKDCCGKTLIRDSDESACSYIERCLTPEMRKVWYEACAEKEKQKEQKPAEWSEEDEVIMREIIDCLQDNATETVFYAATKWLKSLRPQPKQEVTDEEIEEMVTKRSKSSCTTKSEMAFYRNGIKDAIKRFGLCPSWKPSEEQMDALLSAEGLVRANNCPENAKILASLYEQLKKL